jgi:dienelactone hydrolase
MAEIVLFHSALGRRPGMAFAADRLRTAGHVVHTPSYFPNDEVFDDYELAIAFTDKIGYKALMARATEAVSGLPAGLLYAGFSMGGGVAASLAATRPGARAALFLSASLDPAYLPVPAWPSGVAAQIHNRTGDPWNDGPEVIARLAAFIEAGPARCEVFDYPGTGHLFTDPSLPGEFDPQAAALLWTRVLDFLVRLDSPAGGPS